MHTCCTGSLEAEGVVEAKGWMAGSGVDGYNNAWRVRARWCIWHEDGNMRKNGELLTSGFLDDVEDGVPLVPEGWRLSLM